MKKIPKDATQSHTSFVIAKTGRQPSLARFDLQRTVLSAFIGLCLTGVAQASELTNLLQHTLDNPAISASELQSQAATMNASAADMRYWGQGNVFAGSYRYDNLMVVGVFTPGVTPLPAPVSQEISQYGVNYHLPVDISGAIAAERAQARANTAIAQLLARQEELLRLHQTMAAYVRIQALAAQSLTLKAEQKQLEAYAKRMHEEVNLGRTAKLDLSLIESELAQIAAKYAVLEGNQRAALAALKASSGVNTTPISTTIVVPDLQSADEQASLPVALSIEQEKETNASAQKARRSLFPAFSVDSQYTNYDGAGVQLHSWVVGFNLNIPIDPVRFKNLSAAQLQAQAAHNQSLAVQADTLSQISALEASYQSAVGNAKALSSEVEHRQEVVAVERGKWQLGATTMETLLYQERNLLDAQYAFADAHAQAATAWSGIQVLLGTPSTQYINSLE